MIGLKYKLILLIVLTVGIWMLQSHKERKRQEMHQRKMVREALVEYKKQRDKEEAKAKEKKRQEERDHTEWYGAMNDFDPGNYGYSPAPFNM